MISWTVEKIPDSDFLYMRVHQMWVREGELVPGVLRNHGEGMSTDWSRYARPDDTRRRARDPSRNGVIEMGVEAVRRVPGQSVEHRPLPDNRAHTDVLGDKDEEARVKFRRIARWVLRCPGEPPVADSTT